jgi:hypothetical protein
MRKTLWTVGFVAILVAMFVLYQSRLRNGHSNKTQPPSQAAPVLDAAAEPCAQEIKGVESLRLIRVQLLGGKPGETPSVKINDDPVEARALQGQLAMILQTRTNKVVFLTRNADVQRREEDWVVPLLQRAGATKVCVINPNHPPTWTFPKAQPASSG